MNTVKYVLFIIVLQLPQSDYFIEKEIEMRGLSCYDLALFDFGKYNHDLGDCIVYLLGEILA